MPEVAIGTENLVIAVLSAKDFSQGERLEYPMEYFIQHFTFCLPMLIQPLLRTIAVVYWNRQESDHYDAVH